MSQNAIPRGVEAEVARLLFFAWGFAKGVSRTVSPRFLFSDNETEKIRRKWQPPEKKMKQKERSGRILKKRKETVKTPGVDPGQLGPELPQVSVDSRKAGLQEFLDSHALLGGDFFLANSR